MGKKEGKVKKERHRDATGGAGTSGQAPGQSAQPSTTHENKKRKHLLAESGGPRDGNAHSQHEHHHASPNKEQHKKQHNQSPKQHQHQQRHHPHKQPRPPQQQQQQPQPPPKGRHYTLSIAVSASILHNAQSAELRTYLVGEIARAAVIFQVDEIVVYADLSQKPNTKADHRGNGAAAGQSSDPCAFFARLLQYLETPQYLRKALFPHHPDLRLAGLLNPLDAPHHPRVHERLDYREGVTLDKPPPEGTNGSLVNVGFKSPVQIDRLLKPSVRVTVKLLRDTEPATKGVAVSPSEPREVLGKYWGYTVRVASDLGAVFTESPYDGGYDMTIGTSERGDASVDDPNFSIPTFQHLLIVFGGVAGLEACVDATEGLSLSREDTHTLFDVWLNICGDQGSRTIRTEEAVVIALARLRPYVKASGWERSEE